MSELINKQKRIQMRNALTAGESIPRLARAKLDDVPTPDMDKRSMAQVLNKLDRVIRWNHMLTHCTINAHELIDYVTRGAVEHDTNDFMTLRTKVMDNSRTYKFRSIRNIEVCTSDLTLIIAYS